MIQHHIVTLLVLASWATCACQPSAEPQAPHAPHAAPPVVTAPDPDSWRSAIPASGTALRVDYPATERRQLPSGLALYSLTRPTPTQSLGIVCKAGASYDPVGRAGTSALVARMFSEGTTRLDADALAIATERLGANLESSSTEDALTVQLEVLPESTGAALELLSEVLVQPGFRSADFERVRREWLDNLASQREDPTTLSALIARRALLGVHAGQSTLGTPAQVQKLTPADLRSFHRATIVPSRCAVVSAGPLSSAELETLALARLGSWKAVPGKVKRRSPEWANQSRVLFLERKGAVQTSLYVAAATPGRELPGFEARHVINSYFGGIFTSRLITNLREKHAFTYGAYSRMSATPAFGVWSIESDVKSEVTAPAIEQMLLERQHLVDGSTPSVEEVQRAKASLIQRNNARLEHTSNLLDALEVEFVNDLAANYFATLGAVVEHVTPSDLSAQLAHFAPGVSVLALVGPAEALDGVSGWFNVPLERIDATWLDGDTR